MARQLLKTIALRSTLVGAVFGLSGVVVVSCGSDVTCGSGTTKKGDTCVASTTPVDDGGDSGTTGDTGTVTPSFTISFDGVTSVSPVSKTSLQVTWAPATASLTPTNQIVYNVYVGTKAAGENFKAPTAVSPPGATSLLVGNLEADTTYYVVVRAVDQEGNMDTPSTPVELSAATADDTTAPVFGGATGASAVKDSGNSIRVTWEPATDDLTQTAGMGYEVFWSDASSKGSLPSTLGAVTAPGASSAVVTHLPKPLSSYSFYVKAHDAAGNEDDNKIVVTGKTGADVTAPIFGGCVAVTNPGAANATLSWDPAVDDTTTADHIVYNVYAVTDKVDGETLFNLPNGTFTGGATSGVVPGLKPETTYNFVCRAADEAMNEDTNISFRTATTLADNRPPVFKGITNIVPEATTVTLTWDDATDNETAAEQIQYIVYQSTDPNPKMTGVVISPGPELGAHSISIGDLTSNTTYFWAVAAQDSAGNASPPSKDVSAQTLVSFEGDVQPIFTTSCAKSGCHSNNAPMQGQDLSDGNAYSNIVGVPTRFPTDQNPNWNCEHLNRVQPKDPDKSFMLFKLQNSPQLHSPATCVPGPKVAGCCTCAACFDNTWNFGLGMPKDTCITDPSCPGLPDTAIETIKTWITQGALDN